MSEPMKCPACGYDAFTWHDREREKLKALEARIRELEAHDLTKHKVAHAAALAVKDELVDWDPDEDWAPFIGRFCTAIRKGEPCEGTPDA
jgi:hypothetical protein